MLRFVDAAEEARFDRDGFVVRRLLDAAQVSEALGLIDDWARTWHGADAGALPGGLFGGDLFVTTLDPVRERQSAIAGALAAMVRQPVERVVTGARMFDSQLFVKRPAGPAIPLHQHPPFTADPFARDVLCWCPLVDCDATTGALVVIPGSHTRLRDVYVQGERPFFQGYAESLLRDRGVVVEMQAGEAVFFHNGLLHGSVANPGAGARPVIASVWLDADAEAVRYRRAADGGVEVLPGWDAHFLLGEVPDTGDDVVVRRFDFPSRPVAKDRFLALLDTDLHAREDFDPLAHPSVRTPGRPERRGLRRAARRFARAVARRFWARRRA